MGVIPPGTELPPRNREEGDDVPAWSELSPADRRLSARYMEVYAAMVDNVDQNVGRLRAGLAELGVLDDTIFLFLSDNGASREGEEAGTPPICARCVVEREGHRGPGRRPRADRPAGAPHHGPLPRGGPWRPTRRGGSTRSTPTPAATPSVPGSCRTAARPSGRRAARPVGVRDRRAADPARPHRRRRSTTGPAWPSSRWPAPRSRRRCATRGRPPHTEQYFEMNGTVATTATVGDRHPQHAAHAVRRPRVGAYDLAGRPHRGARPVRRASRAVADMAQAWEEAPRPTRCSP